jgi:hypothetical protein
MKKNFLSFCDYLKEYRIYSKSTGFEIFKYELFWSGYDFIAISQNFILKKRKYTDK